MLDGSTGYLTSMASSLYGRAEIAHRLVPQGTTAAELIAFWVWKGGTLPSTVAVMSASHFRSERCGKRVTVLNRSVPQQHLRHLGNLLITSPERTACDIACMPRAQFDDCVGLDAFSLFLEYFELPPSSCRELIRQNPRWPGFANAMLLFDDLAASKGLRYA